MALAISFFCFLVVFMTIWVFSVADGLFVSDGDGYTTKQTKPVGEGGFQIDATSF